jgi:hypothetical protein
MGEERKVYKVLVGEPEVKRPLGRPKRRWENGIRMDLGEIGWVRRVDSVGSGHGPVADSCEYGDEAGATEFVGSLVSYESSMLPSAGSAI